MSKLMTFEEGRKAVTRVIDPECNLYLDPNDNVLKQQHKTTGKIYEFGKFPGHVVDWQNANKHIWKDYFWGKRHRPQTPETPAWTGWAAIAQDTLSGGYSSFRCDVAVPALPSTNGASMLAYWFGLENSNYLIQPCLIGGGGSNWSAQTYMVSLSSTVYVDSGVSVSVGDALSGMVEYNGNPLAPTWQAKWIGVDTGISAAGSWGTFPYALVVKEYHNFSICSDVCTSSGYLTTNIALKDLSNASHTPSWSTSTPGGCSESLVASGARVWLQN